MRIEVLTSLYPGPPRPYEGIFAERRWQGMRARGHDVVVTHPLPRTPGPFARGSWAEIRRMPRHELRGGIRVERPRYLHLPGRARRNARLFARTGAAEIFSRGTPDVVVADYAWPAAAIAPLARARSVPCVVSGRGSDVLLVSGEAGLRDELSAYLRSAGHWCAVSTDLLGVMDELGGVPGRGALVPNGIDLETFHVRDAREARRAVRQPEDAALVLVVGHWIERKDPLLALDVFARGAPAPSRCVFIGRGPLRGALEREIERRALGERVLLAGEMPPSELALWYAASDVVLLTSVREGRPNVVLEALACGRPVLATDAGGTVELLGGLEERCLARGRDPEVLGRMLAALIAAPPAPDDLRASVSHLSWDGSLAALEACLRTAIEEAVASR